MQAIAFDLNKTFIAQRRVFTESIIRHLTCLKVWLYSLAFSNKGLASHGRGSLCPLEDSIRA